MNVLEIGTSRGLGGRKGWADMSSSCEDRQL